LQKPINHKECNPRALAAVLMRSHSTGHLNWGMARNWTPLP